MKWFVAVTLVAASVSLILPALLRAAEADSNGRLERIHEMAAF